ncbi:MAG: prepilin peptidase [Cypionkella sp.]
MTFLPLFLLAPILLAVAYFDLRFMRIPNVICMIALALFLACALMFPPPDLLARFGSALAVLTLGVLAFAFRLIGGGDVKFLSALMLFVPTSALVIFANTFSAAMLIGIVLILGLRRIPATSSWGWKSFGGSKKFPMGLSIALTGLAFPIAALVLRHP